MPPDDDGEWKVKYGWQGNAVKAATKGVKAEDLGHGRVEVTVPFDSKAKPGVKGSLRFVLSAWNVDAAE